MPRKPRILVVDDDVDFIEFLRSALEDNSYQVISAARWEDGLAKVERNKPDLILLDVMMPRGTEGFHFVWKLRNHKKTALRQIPIIMLTALHSTTELRLYPSQNDTDYQPGEFLPVQAFLDKPIDLNVLLGHVQRTLLERETSVEGYRTL